VRRQVFDAFGAARMFWGTDTTRLPCSSRDSVAMFTEEPLWLPGRDLELVNGSRRRRLDRLALSRATVDSPRSWFCL